MQNTSQLAIVTNGNGSPSDVRKLMEDFQRYKGVVLRGWRFIAICVLASMTASFLYIATLKPTYKATSRLLVIQQSGHPVRVGGGNDQLDGGHGSEDNMSTHVLLLKSPVIIDHALVLKGLQSVSADSVIGGLTVRQPDPDAKIIDLAYKSKSSQEAHCVLDGMIESYKLFLKSNYQKNSGHVIELMTKARNELNAELESLEEAYLEYRQKNPAYSANSSGHTFVTRRLDRWEQSLNQFTARSQQLQSQLELAKRMSNQGLDAATIARGLSQVEMIAGNPQSGLPPGTSVAPGSSSGDGSYMGIAHELAEIELRRRRAELYLEHFDRAKEETGQAQEVSDRDIEKAFLDDPAVSHLKTRFSSVFEQLAGAKRAARSASDPAIMLFTKRAENLKEEYQRLWEEKKPEIAERLAIHSNPELGASRRAAEAELITLKAQESVLRDLLDQGSVEELQKLRRQHEQLCRENGESHPSVAQVKQRIASIEGRRSSAADLTEEGTNTRLIDDMTQNLEFIEAMRGDLQKKFDEELIVSQKAEIALLEESNLRSNLERQRTLFNSVVDQLKQARLVSDYDSVSTQTIAPITVVAVQSLAIPLVCLSMALGVGLGSAVAFLADLLEARVRTLAEIRKLVDLPLIGVVPFIKDNRMISAGAAGLVSHQKPRSAHAECYKTTRTNLDFLKRSRQARIILVASSLPGDGKTTTASNLAITLANAGRRVLLIDGDLRKPSLHRMFDVPRAGGLSDALITDESIGSLIQPTFVNNLDLLTTGQNVSNPAELLASERLGTRLKELSSLYDTILVDSSPLLAVTDASIIAAVADGIIWVVRISCIRRHDLDVTNDLLRTLEVPVFGMVINGVTRDQVGYGYGYGCGAYGYGSYGRDRQNGSPNGTFDEHPVNGKTASANGKLVIT